MIAGLNNQKNFLRSKEFLAIDCFENGVRKEPSKKFSVSGDFLYGCCVWFYCFLVGMFSKGDKYALMVHSFDFF